MDLGLKVGKKWLGFLFFSYGMRSMQQIFPCSPYYGSIADSIFHKMVMHFAGRGSSVYSSIKKQKIKRNKARTKLSLVLPTDLGSFLGVQYCLSRPRTSILNILGKYIQWQFPTLKTDLCQSIVSRSGDQWWTTVTCFAFILCFWWPEWTCRVHKDLLGG